MNGKLMRWPDPATAGAYCILRDLAPQLSNLAYCAPMPDAPLATILAWSEVVMEADPGPAFRLERLREVLPALVIAFIASHTYSSAELWDGGGEVIELYDVGCGSVVGEVMALAAMIAIALHAAPGQKMVEAARSDLAGKLGNIAAFIAGR